MHFSMRIYVFLPVVSNPEGVPILGLYVLEESRVVMFKPEIELIPVKKPIKYLLPMLSLP